MEALIAGILPLKFATLLGKRQSAGRNELIQRGSPAILVRAGGVGEAETRKLNEGAEPGLLLALEKPVEIFTLNFLDQWEAAETTMGTFVKPCEKSIKA